MNIHGNFGPRMPTVIGLLLLGVLVGTMALLLRPGHLFRLVGRARAPFSISPQDIVLSNLTDSTAVITWRTDQPAQGYVTYETENRASMTAYDIRDREDAIPKAYTTHFVELSHMPSSSTVTFTIMSGDMYAYSGSLTLGPALSQTIVALPIHGELRTADGSTSKGTIVLATPEGGSTWSTFIQDTTNWVIPMAYVRTAPGDNLYCTINSCERDTMVNLQFIGEEGTQTYSVPIDEARPVIPLQYGVPPGTLPTEPTPTIPTATPPLLATDSIESTSSPAVKSATSVVTQKPRPSATGKMWDVNILNPKEEAKLTFPKPLIRGQGIPGKEVVITIESTITQVGKTTVLEDGTWHWTPAYPLDPGMHIVRIDTTSATGAKIHQQHTFYILKSGQQVLADSTPSASLTPANSPTASPTPSPTLTIALSPALTPTGTPSATIAISPTPSPTITPTITPSPTLHVAGGFIPSIFIVTGGALLIVVAFALL